MRPAPISAVISSRIRPGQEAGEPSAPGSTASPPRRHNLQGSRATGSSPRSPACKRIGWRSCVLTASAISRRGSIHPRGRSCSRKRRRFSTSFTPGSFIRGSSSGFHRATAHRHRQPGSRSQIVLLLLYPVVFLFGTWVQEPLLTGKAGLPFWLALFIRQCGKRVAAELVGSSWASRGSSAGGCSRPANACRGRTSIAGTALIALLYAAYTCWPSPCFRSF